MIYNRLFKILGVVCFSISCAHAEMTIEIIGGGANKHAIAVLPFKDQGGTLPLALNSVVANDLNLSGLFKLINVADQELPFPVMASEIDSARWQAAGAQSVVVGEIKSVAPDKMLVRFELFDLLQKKTLTSGAFTVRSQEARPVAHAIADMIYEAMTGKKGFFNTKIAYVLKKGKEYQLQVADIDGGDAQTIMRSHEPIMSPAWSPDGQRIAYVSFEAKKPIVWVQNLSTGRREVLANFKGSNSAPAWSPDGKTIALVLTVTGKSQIYLMGANGGPVKKLTSGEAINTEPAWSPDGQSLLFVSDRSGGPQIYQMPIQGGEPKRLTWSGSYNVSPRIAPDGKSFTYIQREGRLFKVMLQDLSSSDARVISQDSYDERPSFAPNGSMVLYASDDGKKHVLYAVTQDGSSKIKLAVIDGEVQDPTWGPSLN